jgi:hypothetical protein
MYVAAARVAPRVQYAQVNTTEDATQLYFLGLLGVKNTPLVKELAATYDDIKEAVPSFRSYTAPGKAHPILRSNALYTTTVDSVAFKDWLTALVNGDEVEDVGTKLLVKPVPAPKKPVKKAPAAKPPTAKKPPAQHN